MCTHIWVKDKRSCNSEMRLKLIAVNPSLRGGFGFGHRGAYAVEVHEPEPRRRLGTTVSEATYTELVRITEQYQLRLSQILDEAILRGLIERSAEMLSSSSK
jgi:uncharacterized protein YbgA (DUF1722 family)